LSFEILT